MGVYYSQMFSTTLTLRLCSRKHLAARTTCSFSRFSQQSILARTTRTSRLVHDSLHLSTSSLVSSPNYLRVRHFSRSLLRLSPHNGFKQPTPTKSTDEDHPETNSKKPTLTTLRENIYTIPNLLTVSRILACPVLGWSIVNNDFTLATGLLVYAGLTDLVSIRLVNCSSKVVNFLHGCLKVDGYLARRYNMQSVLGTILDPAADKTLMTTLTITLAMKGLLPGTSC